MAKTAEADAPETPKTKSVFSESGTYAEGGYKGLKWGVVDIDGVSYRMRQVTVDEGDANYDAANDERAGRFNGRLNSRLNLAVSIESPETTIDDMGKWSGAKLVALLRAWDELNLLPAADTEGNS